MPETQMEPLMAQPTTTRHEDWATALFAVLDVAQARGDYARAARVQRQLERMGWIVTRRRPSPPPSAGQEAPDAHA